MILHYHGSKGKDKIRAHRRVHRRNTLGSLADTIPALQQNRAGRLATPRHALRINVGNHRHSEDPVRALPRRTGYHRHKPGLGIPKPVRLQRQRRVDLHYPRHPGAVNHQIREEGHTESVAGNRGPFTGQPRKGGQPEFSDSLQDGFPGMDAVLLCCDLEPLFQGAGGSWGAAARPRLVPFSGLNLRDVVRQMHQLVGKVAGSLQ
mmetsp:Transcript_95170/g.217933  ORF Transcript_95170/g.217933 Transcript_95170/m.217933 type:complete len:205 (-) Transcript_95170:979-1593(-)